jgi:hypothetical protein
LSEAQSKLAQLIEETIKDEIDAIGEPTLDGDVITVKFQYGAEVHSAVIDTESGSMEY